MVVESPNQLVSDGPPKREKRALGRSVLRIKGLDVHLALLQEIEHERVSSLRQQRSTSYESLSCSSLRLTRVHYSVNGANIACAAGSCSRRKRYRARCSL